MLSDDMLRFVFVYDARFADALSKTLEKLQILRNVEELTTTGSLRNSPVCNSPPFLFYKNYISYGMSHTC